MNPIGTMLAMPLCCEKGVRPSPEPSKGVNRTGEGPSARPKKERKYEDNYFESTER